MSAPPPPLASANASPRASASPSPSWVNAPSTEHDQILASTMAENQAMHSAGALLQQQVAALAAEKERLLAMLAQQQASAVPPATNLVSFGKPKGPTPTEFHGRKIGFEVDSWIRDMKVQFECYPSMFTTDCEKVRHAARFFKGPAAEWWETEASDGEVTNCWDKFVERLHLRYRPMQAKTVARARLDQLKQRGTVSMYADLFQKELTPIKDMSPADQIFFFLKGLSDSNVANRVREKEPTELHHAMDLAVRAEAFHGKGGLAQGQRKFSGYYASSANSTSAGSTSAPMDLNAVASRDEYHSQQVPVEQLENDVGQSPHAGSSIHDTAMRSMINMMAAMESRLNAMSGQSSSTFSKASGGDRVPNLKPGDIDRLLSEGRCFRCKEKGHMKRDCSLKAKTSDRLKY